MKCTIFISQILLEKLSVQSKVDAGLNLISKPIYLMVTFLIQSIICDVDVLEMMGWREVCAIYDVLRSIFSI